MDSYPHYYRRSGAFNPLLTITWTVPMMIVGALAGAAYAYVIWYNPFIYINLIAPFLLGLGTCLLTYVVVKSASIRNLLVVGIVGLLIGAASLVGAWESWLHLLIQRDMSDILATFQDEFEVPEAETDQFLANLREGMAADLAEVGISLNYPPFPNPMQIPVHLHERVAPIGVWTVRGTTVKGIWLELIWLLEALVLVAMPVIAGIGITAGDVFDEITGEWLSEDRKIEPIEPVTDLAGLKNTMERGDFAGLAALRRISSGATSYTQVELMWNPGRTAFAVRLREVTITRTKDEETKTDKVIVPAMLVSPEQFAVAEQAGSQRFSGDDIAAREGGGDNAGSGNA